MDEKLSPLWKSLILALALLPVAAGIGYLFGRRAHQEDWNPAAAPVRSSGTRPAQSLSDARKAAVQAAPRAASSSAISTSTSTAEAKVSAREACAPSWRALAGTDLTTLSLDVERRRPSLDSFCLQAMQRDPAVARWRAYVERCQGRINSLREDELRSACVPPLADFRSFVIYLLGQDDPADDADLPELANRLYGAFGNLRDASLADLDRTSALADALIERSPETYAAYKAKLVTMLLKEMKFGVEIDPNEYRETYGRLLEFDQPGSGDPTAGEGPGPSAMEVSGVDRDLVHLPFLRLEAKGALERVDALASDYIDAYPQSYVGYFYRADVMARRGDEAGAIEEFRRGLGPNVSEAAAQEMFRRLRTVSPEQRLYQTQLR